MMQHVSLLLIGSLGLHSFCKFPTMKMHFFYCHNEWMRNGFSRYGLFFSPQFCEYFSEHFENTFFKETGLKPSTKVTLAGYKQPNHKPIYEPGLVSRLNLVLWIMPEYNDNISFCWKSRTGKIIQPTDENFDETDLECWIEGLKPTEYWLQAATEKKTHPFQIANLPFELKVYGFGTHMQLRIYAENKYEIITNEIATLITKHNTDSENMNRALGVVHNYNTTQEDAYICLGIDVGSAGIGIIKKILKRLAKITGITKVEMDL